MDIATGQIEDNPDSRPEDAGKDPAAVSLGQRGGLKGGKARAAKLSPEQRIEIAKRAAAKRWLSKKRLPVNFFAPTVWASFLTRGTRDEHG